MSQRPEEPGEVAEPAEMNAAISLDAVMHDVVELSEPLDEGLTFRQED